MSDKAGAPNGGTVDRLLLEAGLDDYRLNEDGPDNDAGLRTVLLELQSLASEQPEPSDAVAALMIPAADRLAQTRHLAAVPGIAVLPAATAALPAALPAELTEIPDRTAPAAVTDELAARRRVKRRLTLTTLSVAVSLAAGGAVAVASDQGLRDSIGQVNHAVHSFVATMGGGPAPALEQAPARVPGGTTAPATQAPAPAVTQAPAVPPRSGGAQDSRPTPAPSGSTGVPAPDLSAPDVTPGEPLTPGGQLNRESPDLPVPPPALPLPATPPVQLPGLGQ